MQHERKQYDDQLEGTQRGALDVTPWLSWFLACLLRAVQGADGLLASVQVRKYSAATSAIDIPVQSRREGDLDTEEDYKPRGLTVMICRVPGVAAGSRGSHWQF